MYSNLGDEIILKPEGRDFVEDLCSIVKLSDEFGRAVPG